jgi:hypothetical protein
METLAPSSISATASAAVITLLSCPLFLESVATLAA